MAQEKEIYELPSFEGNGLKSLIVNSYENGLIYAENILYEILGESFINIRDVASLALILSGEVVRFEGEYYLGL